MAKEIAKFYKFKCLECDERFEKLMWTKDGEQQGVNCPSCDHFMLYTKETADVKQPLGAAPAIHLREKWKKKIPGDFREFIEGPFAKRHGTENTINMRDE